MGQEDMAQYRLWPAIGVAAAALLVFLFSRGKESSRPEPVADSRQQAQDLKRLQEDVGRALSGASVSWRDIGSWQKDVQLPAPGGPVSGMAANIQGKLKKLGEEADRRTSADRPPIRVVMTLQRFEPLVQEGKLTEAEAVLDRALKLLEGEDSLERKLGQVTKGVEELQKQGKDPAWIGLTMSDFDPLLKAGKDAEAERLLDRALELLKSKDLKKDPEAQRFVRVSEKMSEVQRRLPEWKKAGGKEYEIAPIGGPIGGPIGELIQAGKLEEAERSLDKLLEILRKQPTSAGGP